MQCQFPDCKAHAMKNGELCFTHNPATKSQHLEAAAKGGLVSRDIGSTLLPELALTQIPHVIALLQDTLNKIRVVKDDGTMDIRVANCVGFLAGQLMKAIELSDISSRLEIIEHVILSHKSFKKR